MKWHPGPPPQDDKILAQQVLEDSKDSEEGCCPSDDAEGHAKDAQGGFRRNLCDLQN
jgi:hypothetical protein